MTFEMLYSFQQDFRILAATLTSSCAQQKRRVESLRSENADQFD